MVHATAWLGGIGFTMSLFTAIGAAVLRRATR
jgi:Na+/H+ antiporter NhaA